MKDDDKSRRELLDELAELRRRLAAVEASAVKPIQPPDDERRFQTLMSNLPGMAYRCRIDADWTMEFVSEGCLPLTGYQCSELCHNRVSSYGALIHPDDRRMVWDGVQEALAEKRHFQLEYRIRTATGEDKWVWEQGVAVYSEDDQAEALEGFITDMTGQKRAEAALRKAHDELEQMVQERTAELTKANKDLVLFRRLAEASGQGFGIADMDGIVCYVNPAMCRLCGEDGPEGLLGRKFLTMMPPESRRIVEEEVLPSTARNVTWTGELSLLTRQGTLVPALASSLLIRDERGLPYRMAAVITDITEHKRAEESLRQSEEKCRRLVEASPDAVIMCDLEGHVTFASPRLAEVYGCENAGDFIGKTPLEYIAPEDHAKFFFNFKRTLEEGVVRNVEYTFFRKDGTRFPGEASGAVIRDTSGRPVALTVVLRDITEHKRAREALEREHRTLRHLLQSSDHERQLIAYEIHDGLAQYLAGAIMQLQSYAHLKDVNPRDAVKAYDAGMTMLRQGHSEARRLISGVRPPILDEDGIVAAIVHLINEERHHNGATIEFHSEVAFDRLVPILENAMYRIIQEGLTNACKHSKSDKVRVELVQQETNLRISIQDWGVGFNPEDVEDNCFGLAGIRERARLLGGRAMVESTPGHGTCMTVDLPLALRE